MLFLLLICLFPVALYLAVLGTINRRERPLMVSGTWDFMGALLASSGFLLVAGPAIMASFLSGTARHLLLRLDGRTLPELLSKLGGMGLGPWLIYYGGMLALVVGLLFWRRTRTVIYNIDPDHFEQILHDLIERRGQGAHRGRSEAAGPNGERPALPVYPGDTGNALVRLERFDSMNHVTLHWRVSGHVREELETELARALRGVSSPENPAGNWLLGISTGLFAILTVTALVVIIGTMMMQARM